MLLPFTLAEEEGGEVAVLFPGDVYSPLMEDPVRCEFFDDEIDSLGSFDLLTQRRTKNLEEALLLPALELPLAGQLIEGGNPVVFPLA